MRAEAADVMFVYIHSCRLDHLEHLECNRKPCTHTVTVLVSTTIPMQGDVGRRRGEGRPGSGRSHAALSQCSNQLPFACRGVLTEAEVKAGQDQAEAMERFRSNLPCTQTVTVLKSTEILLQGNAGRC